VSLVSESDSIGPLVVSGQLPAQRVLLLAPPTSYQIEDFLVAAERLGVEVVVAADQASTLHRAQPNRLLTIPLTDPHRAARAIADFARHHAIGAVIGVDEETTVVAAAIARELGLRHIPFESATAVRDKYQLRRRLQTAGLPVPWFRLVPRESDPHDLAQEVAYPCVLKPLFLSASRGVIRVNNPDEFVRAFARVGKILNQPDVVRRGGALARSLLIEGYIPGQELALEGLVTEGELQVLAVFDKPDPLEGPYFEETIYVTPSRLPLSAQASIRDCTRRACLALGLDDGPIHAELRFNGDGPWIIEVAARTIGGLCSRTLRFGLGLTLEEVVLRHALRMPLPSFERHPRPAGVMMIPIPRRGILREVRGLAEASAVPGIEGVTITVHRGEELIPLPEGSRYLGFIFARAETPQQVEAALREAHRCLSFVIEDSRSSEIEEPETA